MSSGFDQPGRRRDIVTIPVIRIAFAASLLMHGAVLWQWPPEMLKPPMDDSKVAQASARMQVRLLPKPSPAPVPLASSAAPARPATPAPPRVARPPKAAARPPSSPPTAPSQPPVVALTVPEAPVNTPPPAPTPRPSQSAPAPPSVQGDMLSMLEEKRRARGEAAPDAPPLEDEKARHNRIVAESLGLNRPQGFGYDPKMGGGVFQIERMGFDSAEFLFFGWNKDIRRNTRQLIEVRRGAHSDTRIAVVRRMISIIREHEQGDFIWESRRLGRNLALSARLGDNAGLEEFLLLEFFEDPRRPR